jgi:Fe-S oxidoreductase
LTSKKELFAYAYGGTEILQELPGASPSSRAARGRDSTAEATWCCGSAEIYNITEAEMSAQLLERKMRHIQSSGATIVASANPGCTIQLQAGARRLGITVEIVHPVSLLAKAYREEARS